MRIGRKRHGVLLVTTSVILLGVLFVVVAEAYISHQEMVQGRQAK